MALAIGPPVIIPFLLFGGFFLNNRYRLTLPVLSCDVIRTVTLSRLIVAETVVVRCLVFRKFPGYGVHPVSHRFEYRKASSGGIAPEE
jgi:hypothetical protein